LVQGAQVSRGVESRMQSERLILTPVLQVRPVQQLSFVGLLEPQIPFTVSHALTDIDVVKVATTAMMNEKRMACARLYRMC
jgi:hypothetical protein